MPSLILIYMRKHDCSKLLVLGLVKNVQMQGAQKAEPRGVYLHTLSTAVCSTIPILSGQVSAL